MKFLTYPPFLAIGCVQVFENGSSLPTVTLRISRYIRYYCEACGIFEREARRRLEDLGATKERCDAMYFEFEGITEVYAVEPRGVRRNGDERVEAFLDGPGIKKRDVLIRQRRLVPHDERDVWEIYSRKKQEQKAAEEVAA